jgi:hypothetical protein
VEVRLSKHAIDVLTERTIERAWMEATLSEPDQTENAADGTVHDLRRVEEFGQRCLRVVVNPRTEPPLVVTLFFDRRVK